MRHRRACFNLRWFASGVQKVVRITAWNLRALRVRLHSPPVVKRKRCHASCRRWTPWHRNNLKSPTRMRMSTLDALLKDPTLVAAELIKLQAGQPIVCKLGQNVVPVGAPIDANAVNTIVQSFMPPDQSSLLSVQPAVQFNVNVPGVGGYIAKVGKDATGGFQAILQRNAPAAVGVAPVAAAPAPVAYVPPPPPPMPIAVVTPPGGKRVLEIDKYFRVQLDMKASDMHLSADVLPMVRHDGEMRAMNGFTQISSPADTERILWELMPEKARTEFKERHDTDFAYEFGDEARFRCNVFMDRKGWGGVFRVIPSKILSAETLNLSAHILKLCF